MKTPAATSYSSDVAFTPTVKAIQSRKGSRPGYASMEKRGSWETRITPDLAEFIGRQTSVFLGTASRDSQPYIQSIAADRPVSSRSSTTRRSVLPITPATANTSRGAI